MTAFATWSATRWWIGRSMRCDHSSRPIAPRIADQNRDAGRAGAHGDREDQGQRRVARRPLQGGSPGQAGPRPDAAEQGPGDRPGQARSAEPITRIAAAPSMGIRLSRRIPTTIRSTAVRIVPDEQQRAEQAPRLGTDDERGDREHGQQDHPAGLRQDAAVDPLAAGRPRHDAGEAREDGARPRRAGPSSDRRRAGTRPARGRRCRRAGRPARCRARRGDASARFAAPALRRGG